MRLAKSKKKLLNKYKTKWVGYRDQVNYDKQKRLFMFQLEVNTLFLKLSFETCGLHEVLFFFNSNYKNKTR
jgi:hypothetical protein